MAWRTNPGAAALTATLILLAGALSPASATLLNFNAVATSASTPAPSALLTFEVTYPPDPIIPVEILSLRLESIRPGDLGVEMTGSDNGSTEGTVIFALPGASTPPDDGLPISFGLFFDVAPLLGSTPTFANPPDDTSPARNALDVMFDTGIAAGTAEHLLQFAAADPFEIANVSISTSNSFNLLFDLVVPAGRQVSGDGTAIAQGQTLLTMTVSGKFQEAPEPSTLALFGFAVVGLGCARRRGRPA